MRFLRLLSSVVSPLLLPLVVATQVHAQEHAQEPALSAAPVDSAPAPVAPIEAPALLTPNAPLTESPPTEAQCVEPRRAVVEVPGKKTNALAPFAEAAHQRRVALGLAAAAGSAAMIATSITYLIVSQVDLSLDPKNAVDTRTGGVVIGVAALVPLAIAGYELLFITPVEEHSAALASGAAPKDIANDIAKQGMPLLPLGVAGGLIVGGLGSAALGGYFLALPHIPPHRGPMSHATGAELIGLGTAMVGAGAITIAYALEDTAPQLAALE